MALGDQDAVTVVIPTHNRLALLLETLRSVAEQGPRAQSLVVAAGSTDGTQDALAARGVPSICHPAGGLGSGRARNAGLAQVTTPFVAFVDSDDLLVPGALDRLVAALGTAPQAPFAFGFGLAASHEPAGWTPEGLLAPTPAERRGLAAAIYARNFVPSSGAVVRTGAARAIQGYDPGLVYSEDQDFWLRLARPAEPVFAGGLVSIHRRHTGNRHVSARAKQDDDTIGSRASTDPRMAANEPARRGMQLCEEALDALRSRRPAVLGSAVERLLVATDHRGATLSAAGRHFRRRRAARAAGIALWDADPALRDWLAGYA